MQIQPHRLGETQSGVVAARAPSRLAAAPGACRRAYYRVEGRLPLRITRIAPQDVDEAIFELTTPSTPMAASGEAIEDGPLLDRLRRIEEKLDLLLAHAGLEAPRPLGAADLRALVFSGSGLSTEVDWHFHRGEAFRVEILLPAPYARVVRAVGEAVEDSRGSGGARERHRLALALTHMHDEERDALVAYSYDLQRLALRAARAERGTST